MDQFVGTEEGDTLHTYDMFEDQEQEGKEAKDDEDDREEDQNQQDRIGPLCPTGV